MGVVYIQPCGGHVGGHVGGQEGGGSFWGNLFLAHLVLGQYIFLSQTINFQYCNYDSDLESLSHGCSLCEQEEEVVGEEGEGGDV